MPRLYLLCGMAQSHKALSPGQTSTCVGSFGALHLPHPQLARSRAERRSIRNVQYSEDDEEGDTAMRPQSYARMRYRNRDRLPKWAKRIVKSVRAFLAKDPVATYLLREGPMTWYWNWLTKR